MKAGRQLELLVAKIKEMLHADARIESPAFVLDRDTGEEREVDVGIWKPTDHGEIFIAVECRDRGAVQDVTWIEQLIAKKDSVCADVLIAVTASRFTGPAVVKAAKRGVLVRTLTGALAEEIATWASEAYIEIRACRVEISDVIFETGLGKVIGKAATRLFNIAKRREESLDQFVSEVMAAKLREIGPHLVNHGDHRRVSCRGKTTAYEVLLPFRTRVASFAFDSVVRRHVERMPVASGFSYDDVSAASRLVEGYQFDSAYGATGDVLIDLQSDHGRLVLDFSHFSGWVDETVLKAGRPIALTSVVVTSYGAAV